MEYRNAIEQPNGFISCEINHPEYGWIPCALSEHDDVTKDLYHEVKAAGDYALPSQEAIDAALAEEAYQAFKAERTQKVRNIVVSVDGMEFNGDEDSQNRMARAVAAADSIEETINWRLANNTAALVTAAQLKQALKRAGEAQTTIWHYKG